MACDAPAVATLGELHADVPWLWLDCRGCRRRRAIVLAPLVIRWGPATSSDVLRANARCSACGHKGAGLMLPSWGGCSGIQGALPCPVDRAL